MAEEAKSTEAAPAAAAAVVDAPVVQSPPAAPAPTAARTSDEPRMRLHQVAAALSRGLNRQLLAEYLQLRRICRQ